MQDGDESNLVHVSYTEELQAQEQNGHIMHRRQCPMTDTPFLTQTPTLRKQLTFTGHENHLDSGDNWILLFPRLPINPPDLQIGFKWANGLLLACAQELTLLLFLTYHLLDGLWVSSKLLASSGIHTSSCESMEIRRYTFIFPKDRLGQRFILLLGHCHCSRLVWSEDCTGPCFFRML